MVTMVGTQKKFSDAIVALIELDNAAIEAYEVAVERLHKVTYKEKLTEFMLDHRRHVADLGMLLGSHQEKMPGKRDVLKPLLTKGKVIIASLVGDKTILAAMSSNELDTNKAYELMVKRQDMWEDAKKIIKRGLADEIKHKKYLDHELGKETVS